MKKPTVHRPSARAGVEGPDWPAERSVPFPSASRIRGEPLSTPKLIVEQPARRMARANLPGPSGPRAPEPSTTSAGRDAAISSHRVRTRSRDALNTSSMRTATFTAERLRGGASPRPRSPWNGNGARGRRTSDAPGSSRYSRAGSRGRSEGTPSDAEPSSAWDGDSGSGGRDTARATGYGRSSRSSTSGRALVATIRPSSHRWSPATSGSRARPAKAMSATVWSNSPTTHASTGEPGNRKASGNRVRPAVPRPRSSPWSPPHARSSPTAEHGSWPASWPRRRGGRGPALPTRRQRFLE